MQRTAEPIAHTTTDGRVWERVHIGTANEEGRRASCDHCGRYVGEDFTPHRGDVHGNAWRYVSARGIEWLACSVQHCELVAARLTRPVFVVFGVIETVD